MRINRWKLRPVIAWTFVGILYGACCAPLALGAPPRVRVMTFNILQGGNHAGVGFPDSAFGGSRKDDIARAIFRARADVVGVQEDDRTNGVLRELGKEWHREGSIDSKYPLARIAGGVRVQLPEDRSLVMLIAHWWPTGGYGPWHVRDRLKKGDISTDLNEFETQILRATAGIANGPRGYLRTINLVKPLLEAGENVVVTGDFNEPSHKDWTEAAAKRGMDRWVKNSSGRPLRFKIAWAGSVALERAGLKDAYRTAYPDEVKKPGNTWTPQYKTGTPGRIAYEDQILDRIDRIHFAGPNLRIVSAAVVGESKETCEIVHKGPWVSDHRAVVAEFEFTEKGK